MRSSTGSRSGSVIIVAPRELWPRLADALDRDALTFANLDELDRWRNGDGGARELPIADALARALAEENVTVDALHESLRELFDAMRVRVVTPTVDELQSRFSSRRSFYRLWRAAIHVGPSEFLRRVRTLHARMLVESGMAAKTAAHYAGFRTAEQLRRRLRQR